MERPKQTNNNYRNSIRRCSGDESGSEKESESQSCCPSLLQRSLHRDSGICQFLRDSSMHGVRYIGGPARHLFERLFWLVVVLASVVAAVYFVQNGVLGPMQANPIIISFQSEETTVDQIPFPAFTLCNANKIKRSPMEEIAANVTKYVNIMNSLNTTVAPKGLYVPKNEIYALQYLDRYCEGSRSFLNCMGYADNYGKIDYRFGEHSHIKVHITEDLSNTWFRKDIWSRAKKAFHQCEDMILLCIWEDSPHPCSEMFTAIKTEFGYCCTFNMIPRFIQRRMNFRKNNSRVGVRERAMKDKVAKQWSMFDMETNLLNSLNKANEGKPESKRAENKYDKYPKHQEQAGANNGLSILVNPELSEYHCMAMNSIGFKAEVHSLIDNPHVTDLGHAIKPGREAFVAVRAEITIGDKDLKRVDLEKRQCYFYGEYNLTNSKFYTQRNCIDECIADMTFKICDCLLYFMPHQPNQTLCIPALYPCALQVKKNLTKSGFKTGCPMCRPTCFDVEYRADVNVLPLRKDIPMWKNFTTHLDEKWTNENVSIIHVYFESNTVETKVRKRLFGFEEVLADAGGLIGLTLGVSVISLIEPFYYFTLRRLFLFLRSKHDRKSKRGVAKNCDKGCRGIALATIMTSQRVPVVQNSLNMQTAHIRTIEVKPSSDIVKNSDRNCKYFGRI